MASLSSSVLCISSLLIFTSNLEASSTVTLVIVLLNGAEMTLQIYSYDKKELDTFYDITLHIWMFEDRILINHLQCVKEGKKGFIPACSMELELQSRNDFDVW